MKELSPSDSQVQMPNGIREREKIVRPKRSNGLNRSTKGMQQAPA